MKGEQAQNQLVVAPAFKENLYVSEYLPGCVMDGFQGVDHSQKMMSHDGFNCLSPQQRRIPFVLFQSFFKENDLWTGLDLWANSDVGAEVA